MRHVGIVSLLAAALMVAGSGISAAQSMEDIDAAEEELIAAWEQTPLSFRTAVFTEGDPQGFGIYNERETAEFASDEPIVIYAEPVGYIWHDNGDGTYSFGFDVDLLLKKPDGTIVGGQENFQHLELTSRARNREFMLTLTLTVEGAPPGDYIVEYTTRDIASDKSGVISLPFSITE